MKNKQFAQNLRLTHPHYLRTRSLVSNARIQEKLDRYAEWATLALMVVLTFIPFVLLAEAGRM